MSELNITKIHNCRSRDSSIVAGAVYRFSCGYKVVQNKEIKTIEPQNKEEDKDCDLPCNLIETLREKLQLKSYVPLGRVTKDGKKVGPQSEHKITMRKIIELVNRQRNWYEKNPHLTVTGNPLASRMIDDEVFCNQCLQYVDTPVEDLARFIIENRSKLNREELVSGSNSFVKDFPMKGEATVKNLDTEQCERIGASRKWDLGPYWKQYQHLLPSRIGTAAKAMAKAAAVTALSKGVPMAQAAREDSGLDLTVYSNWPTIFVILIMAMSIFLNGFIVGYITHYIQHHNTQ
jgi:hypothetical protein